ncbi:MAG TPA: hypothetical protein VK869_07555 [Rubrobacteraceae bacterium]|nr:hypothetical protein [Rubrobacteraceae bacterium]
MASRFTAITFTGLFALTVSVLALLALAPAAQAEERKCRGTIGATTVDNLLVPQGATCTLNGTRVKGTVKVANGAKLFASGIRVVGNVQSEGFQVVVLKAGSRIGGNVQLENGRSGGNGKVVASRINGDLQIESNKAKMVSRGSTILANLQAFQNTGGVVLKNNTIAENLQCKQNNPAPVGGGNKAGDKEGQCRTL